MVCVIPIKLEIKMGIIKIIEENNVVMTNNIFLWILKNFVPI